MLALREAKQVALRSARVPLGATRLRGELTQIRKQLSLPLKKSSGPVMMKFMLDSNIFDAVIAEADLVDRLNALSEKGVLTLLTTHIQEDELAKIPDFEKRTAISKIRRTCVTTAGAVLDVSRLDMCTLGDGSESGCNLGDIQSTSGNHVHDALIATTASRDVDILVTHDKRLQNRVEQSGARCRVLNFEQFKAYVYQMSKEGFDTHQKAT